MKKLLIALLLLTTPSFANHEKNHEITLQYGLGLLEGFSPRAQVKNFNVGYRYRLIGPLYVSLNGGAFFDAREDIATGYGFGQIGTVVHPFEWFYFENFFGPGAISQTDSRLGSHFQFGLDLGVGFREPHTKATIGVNYKHISNAGIKQPNLGRDFVMLKVGIPF